MQSVLSHLKEEVLQWIVEGGVHDGRPVREDPLTPAVTSTPALTCQLCRIGVENGTSKFKDVTEQRDHFKSDWHRYNLHLSLKQRPVVGREQFEQRIEEEEVSSISGSESDTEDEGSTRRDALMTGMVHLTSKDGKSFRIWRCLLFPQKPTEDTDEYIGAIDRLAALQHWAVILAKGGHFAAACFEKSNNKTQGLYYNITLHKTLHRYVIRAKAGGRQSTKDATGKHAKSAGSSLRRYNEAALERDITEILKSWTMQLQQCDVIFTAVSASDNRAVFGGDRPPLDQKNQKIRKVPFPTRRPTFSETKRVTQMLFSIYEMFQSKQQDDVTDDVTNGTIVDVVRNAMKQEIVDPQLESVGESVEDRAVTSLPSSLEEANVDAHDLNEQTSNPHPASKSKKKSRRRQKGKDQRRKAAMHTADDVVDEPEAGPDEVECAIAEAAAQMKKMQQRKTPTQKSKIPSKPQGIEERREVMRKAAEKRMADLQSTAQKQQLW